MMMAEYEQLGFDGFPNVAMVQRRKRALMNGMEKRKTGTAVNDEYYTPREWVEEELERHIPWLRGKWVYLPCDDPSFSQFWAYLYENFERIGLKRLTATYFQPTGMVYMHDKCGDAPVRITRMAGNGDFRNEENLVVFRQADVVITNPPFSLLVAFLELLMQHKRDYLLIVPVAALGYKGAVRLASVGRCWVGFRNKKMMFKHPTYVATHWLTSNPAAYLGRDYTEVDEYRILDSGIPEVRSGALRPAGKSQWFAPVTAMRVFNPLRYRVLQVSCKEAIDGKRLFARLLIAKNDQEKEGGVCASMPGIASAMCQYAVSAGSCGSQMALFT